MNWRAGAFERLSGRGFDLLVIGAGIVGARVAHEAASAGLAVALVDSGDFGGGTSSASSKLVHGGFRYLPRGHIRLVRESQAERLALLRHVAPNLVRPLTCLLAVDRRASRRAAAAAGLVAYRALGGQVGWVDRARALRLTPGARFDRLSPIGSFDEAQVHDSRLVLATVRAAAEAGATVLNHARVTAIEAGAALVAGALAGEPRVEVRFRSCVNATGPWVDEVRRLEDPACTPLVRLSRGVHVLLPLPEPWTAAVAVPLAGGRAAVAQPWFGMLLLGTTDIEHRGSPGTAAATAGDVGQVLDEAGQALPAEWLCRDRVLAAFAGLRALPLADGATADASREHLVRSGRLGVLSVAGGKLTTHRRIALDVLRRLDDPRLRRLQPAPSRLPGTGWCWPRPELVAPGTWAHLQRLYGPDASRVAEHGRERPELLEPIHPDGPDIRAQWKHAVDEEWAMTAEDVLRRRTTAGLRGGDFGGPVRYVERYADIWPLGQAAPAE